MVAPHMGSHHGMTAPFMGTPYQGAYHTQMGTGFHGMVPSQVGPTPGLVAPHMAQANAGVMPQPHTHQMPYMQQQKVVTQQPTVRDEYDQDYEW